MYDIKVNSIKFNNRMQPESEMKKWLQNKYHTKFKRKVEGQYEKISKQTIQMIISGDLHKIKKFTNFCYVFAI